MNRIKIFLRCICDINGSNYYLFEKPFQIIVLRERGIAMSSTVVLSQRLVFDLSIKLQIITCLEEPLFQVQSSLQHQ